MVFSNTEVVGEIACPEISIVVGLPIGLVCISSEGNSTI